MSGIGKGRAKKSESQVVIQSFEPNHEILKLVKGHNYKDLLKGQLVERQAFRYPPYFRLIHILVRHRNRRVAEQASSFLVNAMRTVFEQRVLGPEYPAFERLKGYYQKTNPSQGRKKFVLFGFKTKVKSFCKWTFKS